VSAAAATSLGATCGMAERARLRAAEWFVARGRRGGALEECRTSLCAEGWKRGTITSVLTSLLKDGALIITTEWTVTTKGTRVPLVQAAVDCQSVAAAPSAYRNQQSRDSAMRKRRRR
jgi:hypothetical protein